MGIDSDDLNGSPVRALHKLIREVIDQQPQNVGDETVDDIVAAVAGQTPAGSLRDFYIAALRNLVVTEYRVRRNNAMNRLDDAMTAEVIRKRRDPRRPSPMVAAIRTWWSEVLDARVFVKGHEQRLGSCTVSDLDLIIAEHEDRALGHITKAEQYRSYKKMIIDNGVVTLDECPQPQAV